jgi:hypothetical protein
MTVDEFIATDWPTQSSVGSLCLSLWKGLQNDTPADHYTLGTLRELSHAEDSESLAVAVMYLATAKVGVLETSLLYEVDGLFVEVPQEDQLLHSRGEPVVHPRSGMPMEDDQLFVVFVPGPKLLPKKK